jgi:hypothetical protein
MLARGDAAIAAASALGGERSKLLKIKVMLGILKGLVADGSP